MTVKADYEHQ